jgi:hypothetical protein
MTSLLRPRHICLFLRVFVHIFLKAVAKLPGDRMTKDRSLYQLYGSLHPLSSVFADRSLARTRTSMRSHNTRFLWA